MPDQNRADDSPPPARTATLAIRNDGLRGKMCASSSRNEANMPSNVVSMFEYPSRTFFRAGERARSHADDLLSP